MSIVASKNSIHLPLILTVLMVVGAAWSWVSELNKTESPDEVAASLASFALEGAEESASAPLCCPSLKGEAAQTSLAKGGDSSSECCAGSATSANCSGEVAACPGSTSIAKTEGQADHCADDGAMSCPGSASSKTETADAECCPGMSNALKADAGEIDQDLADLLSAVKIPQVQE